MSESIALISSAKISRKELIDFIGSIESSTLLDNDQHDALIHEGDKSIWISMDNNELTYMGEEMKDIEKKLGEECKTCILIEISRQEGSDDLATKFIKAFSNNWKYVVNDFRGKIYSSSELADLF